MSKTAARNTNAALATEKLSAWVISLVCLILVAAAAAQEKSERKSVVPVEARERIRKASAAVGMIFVRNREESQTAERAKGSAVIVRKDGIVVTSYHVITQDKTDRQYDEIYLALPSTADPTSLDPRRLNLKTVVVSKDYDLALLEIVRGGERQSPEPADFPAIELGDSRDVKLLDDLIVIGFPEKGGSTMTVSIGMVEGKDSLENWIKTSARLIHGNSGGAAIDIDGKLIGIPTRVLIDKQPFDKDGDGFPDGVREYGAVGFLRPAYLIAAMLKQLDDSMSKGLPEKKAQPEIKTQAEAKSQTESKAKTDAKSSGARPLPPGVKPQVVTKVPVIVVRGVIRSSTNKEPVAGARVGLIPLGNTQVTATNLLTWGGTNADGSFELNKPVPSGRYTLKAKALGYQPFTLEVEISEKGPGIVIELHPQS